MSTEPHRETAGARHCAYAMWTQLVECLVAMCVHRVNACAGFHT